MTTTYPRAERAAQAREVGAQLAATGIDEVVFGWADNAGLTRVKSVPLALLALGAPGVVSCLRLVPSHFAGAYRCWGLENREAALRLTAGSTAGQANAEVKCFDPAANPYLAIGGVLAAGLDTGLPLPPETTGDPAALDAAERLPASLPEAVDAYEKSALLRQALDPELYETVLAVRRAEAELFATHTDVDVIEAVRWRY